MVRYVCGLASAFDFSVLRQLLSGLLLSVTSGPLDAMRQLLSGLSDIGAL
jgi:hypothetical protein